MKQLKGIRKHAQQMTDFEHDFLWRKFRAIGADEWEYTDYSKSRMLERGIDIEQFENLYYNSYLIEYYRMHGTNRVLVRGKQVKGGEVVCGVFNLTGKRIITVWKMDKDEHHNKELPNYAGSADVLELYKGGKQLWI